MVSDWKLGIINLNLIILYFKHDDIVQYFCNFSTIRFNINVKYHGCVNKCLNLV